MATELPRRTAWPNERLAIMGKSDNEHKEPWFRPVLEYLHHAYWIRDFLISSGVWAAVVKWLHDHAFISVGYAWPLACALIGVSMYLIELGRKRLPKKQVSSNPQEQQAISTKSSNPMTRGVPHNPGSFDSVDYFRRAYYSPLQDVSAEAYRAEAELVRPGNKESFYLDILAIGTMVLIYDDIWWPLYRSQLRALLELNAGSGTSPISIFKNHYEEAQTEFTEEYQNITFEAWMEYLTRNLLVKVYPSDMVEITIKGKDFLKYLLHHSRSEKSKRL
jgi:hypothetical protein